MLVAVLTYVLHACTFLNHYGHLCVLRKLVSFSTTLSAGKLEIKKFGIKNETWFTVALLIKTRRVVQPRLHSQNFSAHAVVHFFVLLPFRDPSTPGSRWNNGGQWLTGRRRNRWKLQHNRLEWKRQKSKKVFWTFSKERKKLAGSERVSGDI